MSSINDWCSQAENIQKLECTNNKNKNIENPKITNTVSIVTASPTTTSSSTTSLDLASSSLPPYPSKDVMSVIVPISLILLGVILLFTIITCVAIRIIKNNRSLNKNSNNNSNNNSNSNLLSSLFPSSSKKIKNKSSQMEILATIKQDADEDYRGEEEEEEENGKERRSENTWEIISIGEGERKEGEEGDQATGDNNSIVIDINNNYYYNNESDVMSEINGEKYYNGIKVPPLGARIIPLERQMEISKELSEKQNYHQYYDNQSD